MADHASVHHDRAFAAYKQKSELPKGAALELTHPGCRHGSRLLGEPAREVSGEEVEVDFPIHILALRRCASWGLHTVYRRCEDGSVGEFELSRHDIDAG